MRDPLGRSHNPMPSPRQVARASLVDRLELWLSEGRVVDGLWVGTGGTGESQSEEILHRVEQALFQIKTHDLRRYNRLRRDLARIWVRLQGGDRGCYNSAVRACELDPRFVLRPSVTPSEVAVTIVHEATHARLEHCGISYSENRRHRIERVCFRQEIAFAQRLPDGTAAAQRAEQWLSAPLEFWSDSAMEGRFDEGSDEALRYAGVPEWLLRVLRAGRGLIRKFRKPVRAA
jgi:hypothetical protein